MPGLQSLFDTFAPSSLGYAQNGELVFQHPLTSMRLALAASADTAEQLASYGWAIASGTDSPAFNTLSALRRAFPGLHSQHPDDLAKVLNQGSVQFLLESQPEEQRGRLARWLISRSQSTGNAELARWTKEACHELPMKADHPLAPSADGATYLASPAGVARITGDELSGYTLFQRFDSTGRTHLVSAPTLDDLWFPSNEWTVAQWDAYEQLLVSSACDAQTFALRARADVVVAATMPQHLLAQTIGISAYLGAAVDDIRRKFRHAPTSQWLDLASASTGISLHSAEGIKLLTDLYLVEQLDDAAVADFIVPAMRAADDVLAQLTVEQLLAIWRNAYDAVLTSAPASRAGDSIKFRTGEPAPRERSTAQSMRTLLSGYYGESAIESLERSGKLHLVTHINELPSEFRDEIMLGGMGNGPSAFCFENTVYMIGDNIEPDRVCGTFLHEVGEHAALSQMLGRDYGRIVSRFNQLLAEGDTYALQAAMTVPASTHPSNLSSEHLAYLIQLTAQDMEAREGGEQGYALGERCIRDLRTWLYRQPLMRDLERQGELENFKLDPQDIATLAREAVDYYVAGSTVPSLDHNQWESRLDAQLLGALHGMTSAAQVEVLETMPADLQMAYLYSLASLNSPQAYATLTSMAEAVANATTSHDPDTRATAGEITTLTFRLSNRGRAAANLESTGLFAAISGTGSPESSVLTIIRQVADNEWQAEHYSRGLGLTLTESFRSIEEAAQIVGHTHFAVDEGEFDSVVAQWGQVLAQEHGQVDSLAFERWHKGSVAKHNDGSPMVLYHGTATDFSRAKGMFWASAPTPAELRPQPTPAPAPAAEAAPVDPFGEWFAESKIIGDDGKPVRLYHGTNANFSTFQISRYGVLGAGIYTTTSSGDAQQYGDTVMALHASISNPLYGTHAEIKAMQRPNETSEMFTERLIGLGYDGIATLDAEGDFDYVVTFRPEQLKSATDNNGQYDRSNADIRFDTATRPLGMTDKPEFLNWFDGSKIVDGRGQPIVAYHGTGADFTRFEEGPTYFTSRTDYSYIRNSAVVMPVYLNIQNPYRPADQSEIETIRSNPARFEELKAQGYDGMVWAKPGDMLRGGSGWGDDLPQFVTFYPSQVKSAISNVGSFDRASADIRFDAARAIQQTELPAFKRWFGQSELVDAGGSPLVLYHGTNQDFSTFDSSAINSRFPYSFGFHFTDSRRESSIYADSVTNAITGFNPTSRFSKPPMVGGNVMPVYLRAERPLIIYTDQVAASMEADLNRNQITATLEAARLAGNPYDSVIIKRERGDEFDGINVIVFDPAQIKSATANVGSFDLASADIRFEMGNSIAPVQQPTFQNWFGQSKVLDAAGMPLVVYHGTGADITTFNPDSFWTDDPSIAQMYAKAQSRQTDGSGPNTVAAYLSLQNPFVFDDAAARRNGTSFFQTVCPEGASGPRMKAAFRELERQGYDGVILHNYADLGGHQTQYVAFSPTQIKSAISNVGSYDRASADIRFRADSRVPQTALPTFNRWFGESKVLDESGAPLVVYHGTHNPFTVFSNRDGAHLGFHFGNKEAANTRLEDTADAHFNHAEHLRLHERASKLWLDVSAYQAKLDKKAATTSPEAIIEYATQQGKQLWEVIGDFAYRPTPDEVAEYERLKARYDQANVDAHKYGAGSHIDAFYLSIERPLRLRDVGDWGTLANVVNALPWDSDADEFEDFEDLISAIKQRGYDGIVYKNVVENSPGQQADSFIAFDPEQIKSAISNVGSFDRESADVRFTFAGQGAATASRSLLSEAKSRREQGEDPEQIRQETGWLQGVDEKWRFEIDDSTARARQTWGLFSQNKSPATFRLVDVLDHWKLFDAYPHLRYMKVTVDPGLNLANGMFDKFEGGVWLYAERDEGLTSLSAGQMKALIHEVQHWIQDNEQFAQGGSPTDMALPSNEAVLKRLNETFGARSDEVRNSPEYSAYVEARLAEIPPAERMREGRNGLYDHGMDVARNLAYEHFLEPIDQERLAKFDALSALKGPLEPWEGRALAYRLLAGETEARNVQERMLLTAAERLATPPHLTQDAPDDSLYLWHNDEVQLASELRAHNAAAPELLVANGRIRFSYSNANLNANMAALADFYTKDDDYQFNEYEQRETIVQALTEQLASDDSFKGMILPVGFGFITITPSAKQVGAWQVTALNPQMRPLSDEGIQSKEVALATFFEQFDTRSAVAVQNGHTEDVQLAATATAPMSDAALKGSILADQYAEMRQDFSLYSEDELDAKSALIMPVYLSAKHPFDADQFESTTLEIGSFRDELVRQAEAAGRQLNIPKIGGLVKTLRLAARNEESGPYYRVHDFWLNNSYSFGGAGNAAIRQLFEECGFDSVKYTEQDHLSFGVFEPSQVKSAIGNTGLFTSSPDIRFSFAGVKAANHNPTRLQIAQQMHEESLSPEQIWQETGWMYGAEGAWRFEVDDSAARIRGYDYEKDEPEVTTTDPSNYMDWAEEALNSSNGVPLSMVLDHPALYEAYPQLQSLRVKAFERKPDELTYGYFAHHPQNFSRSKVFVATPWTMPAGTLLTALSHELQHGIQQIEGFASGATVEAFEKETQDSSPYLKAQMQQYIDIEVGAKDLGCSPEAFAVMSGYEPLVIERVKTWQEKGNWDSNVAWFRRSLMTPYDLYFHEAGEVEARNTQARLAMNTEERVRVYPGATTDVDAALVKATRFIYNVAASNDEAQGYVDRAEHSLGWALKTHRWHDSLQDGAELVHTGDTYNLFRIAHQIVNATRDGELYAVTLQGAVIGAFLYGPGPDSSVQVAAMVAPDHRRRGIASAAHDAVERITGKTLTRGAVAISESASAFWGAREAKDTAAVQPQPADSLAQWFGESHTTQANGSPKTFYHGSLAAFSRFDAARHRSILNNQYQGDAFHFTESPEVASTYAVAARNQMFRQHDVFTALESAQSQPIADLLKDFVLQGDAVWNGMTPEGFNQLRELATASGFDLDDIREVASYVEGSACAQDHENFNLFATHHNSDMPDHIKDLAQAMGLGEAIPTPVVMPVYLKCNNTLYTDDRHQARNARALGYDSVCYSGEDAVAGKAEWMVFDAKNIRSVFEFNKDAQILKPQQNNTPLLPPVSPIAAPTDAGFDHWFEDSHCKNLFGEPRLVFAQSSDGAPFQMFGDADTASVDAYGRITPAYLAMRAPFVVTNSPIISQTDLREKLGERKSAMLMGDLSRDGQLFIEDIIGNPRGAKWLEQAGFDGAIYRNRAGNNSYVLLGAGQSMTASPVNRDLSGPVVWSPVPKLPPRMFAGERALGRQFTLTNLNKPHGHVVPMDSADQFLATSDRLYANWLNGERITAPWIADKCKDHGTPENLKDFLKQNRKALIGKNRVEDVFVSHMANLRESIENARREGRYDSAQASYHRVMEDKMCNALAWAMDCSTRCKSTRGVVAADLLQWNKSLDQQSTMVQQALSTLGIDGFYQVERDGIAILQTGNRYNAEQSASEHGGTFSALEASAVTGRACYEELANDLGGSKWASSVLASMGILGAQQSAGEVMLFQPEFNHQPQAKMQINKGSRSGLSTDSVQLNDLGGVLIDGGIGRACISIESSQNRALEVTDANIRLLMAREANRDLQIGSTSGSTEQTRALLADARSLKKDLSFMVTTRDYLSWKEPMTEQQVQKLAPLIQLDHSHALPGSAAVELLAGQHGVRRAVELLSRVGIAGVHSDNETVCWTKGALKVFNVVNGDTPRAGSEQAERLDVKHEVRMGMSA
ncbi:LPD23 domain-containing protein [Pseudomonas sp. UMAB-40]|uniref:ADP-ribosyltransferase-containing protein n=1 Tax=Pseudomonas sp. UMAB-40 TaxID=1365407 RepID=UPI001C594910|nr:LPD23 domain-containing protein [Pseudomonas sp. UMAB-40]